MGRRLALIIGNSVFRDPALARLLTPNADVGALADVLLDPEIGNFDDAKLAVNMAASTIRRSISEFFTNTNRDDLLLLYFSGHGVLDEYGRLYLATKETERNYLSGTAISTSFITAEMNHSRSRRQVLILDCCHSGAFARGSKGVTGASVGTATAFEGKGYGRVVLTASDATQYAWEGDQLIGEADNSVFTHYLIEGMQTGKADADGDGEITVDELYDYVYAQVVKQTPKQTPGKWSYREQGEIIIARALHETSSKPAEIELPEFDEEIEAKLKRLYDTGLAAYALEEWDRAAQVFQVIVEARPDYPDVSEKLQEARRQGELADLYEKAQSSLESEDWESAAAALEALIAQAPDYRDAATILAFTQERKYLAELYAQGRILVQAEMWEAAHRVLIKIEESDPDYPNDLFATAQRKVERAKQEGQRQEELAAMYAEAVQLLEAGDYQEVVDKIAAIRKIDPHYPDREKVHRKAQEKLSKPAKEAGVWRQKQVEHLLERTRLIITVAAVTALVALLVWSGLNANRIFDQFFPPATTIALPPESVPVVAEETTQAPPTQTSTATQTTVTAEALAQSTTGAITIIIGTTDSIESLDPADAYAIRDWESITNISQGLLAYKPGTADVIPELATAMPDISSDGLTYTFTLKDGVKFGDGTDLTAKMYVDQLNRLLTIGPSCPNDMADTLAVPYIDSITNPSGNTIVIKLKHPVGYFLQILARPPYVATDPNIFPADKCVLFPEAPIYGTGPFYISQFTAKEQAVFEPNPYYTGDIKPQVKQVIVRYFSHPHTMALAVQNGEIDVAWRFLGPDLLGQLKDVSDLTVGAIAGGGIRYFVVNHTMAPMDDPNVRKAVAYAVDRNELSDTVYAGQASPLYSPIPPGYIGADEAFDTMYAAPDLDKAREALAASGYTQDNPLQLDMWYTPEYYGAETAAWMQVIKKQLEATNAIKVNLQAQEWSTYVTALTGGKSYAIGVLGWYFDYPDSSNWIDPFVYNTGEGTNVTTPKRGSNIGTPINDEAKKLVDLLAQADSETDQAKRADLYKQAQETYADMVVTLPLFFNTEHVVYRSGIHGSDQYAVPNALNIGPTIDFNYALLSKSP